MDKVLMYALRFTITALRWVMFALGFIAYPAFVIGFFAGGWFLGAGWFCLYDWLKELDQDMGLFPKKQQIYAANPNTTAQKILEHSHSVPRSGMYHSESTVDLGYPPYKDSDRGVGR